TWTLPDYSVSAKCAIGKTAQMTPVFGPRQYTRLPGPEQTFTETFKHCGSSPCQIVVINGNADGTQRVRGSVFLNGVRIISPTDFNERVARIARPVVLADQNLLTISFAGLPGSFIIVDVECAASSPVILSSGSPGVSLQNPTTLLSALPIIN